MAIKEIVFIGAGRVATQLGLTLREKNKTIVQVYSRSLKSASDLAQQVNAKAITDLSLLSMEADLYIISVVDDAIKDIAAQLQLGHKLVVHTSGSVSMNSINKASQNFGVFYPLQTFDKKKRVDFTKLPICVEGSNAEVESELFALGRELSEDVRMISSGQRLFIHIAAVYACNFSNFMYLMGAEILEFAKVDFDILIPLIQETAHKISGNHPYNVQTGPALRGDKLTMQKHLEILKDHPEKFDMYKNISRFITNYFTTHTTNPASEKPTK